MRETRLTYTPDGLPARTTYPGGKWKEFVYDSNRNVTNILHTARTTPNTAFLHDAFGNVTNATDKSGNAWQFSYTHNSTLTNEVFTSLRLCDSARETNALARLLDAYFRPVGYDLILGDTPRSRVRYGYDTEGRIATLAATNAANRGFQVFYNNESGYNYGYTLTTPNGAILTRTVTRDPFRRSLTLDCTTRFNSVEVASFVYTFDANSRPVTRNDDRFAYNDRDEITSALIGTNRINRAYDTIGNHVFLAYNSATNFYANNALNQTTASYACVPSIDSGGNDTPPQFDGYDILSTNKFTWSAQGGLQRDDRFIYAFDAEDHLVSVTSSVLSNGAIRVVNAYDYRHRRISKTVYTMRDDSPPTSPLVPPLPIAHRTWYLKECHDFVYDDWNLIHETVTTVDANSTTNITKIEYFWGPDLSNTLQGAGGVGGLLAVSQNGTFYFPIYDYLGNIVKYVDESGTVVAAYDYDDFGRTLSSSGLMSDVFAVRFSTKYFDRETWHYYYGKRFSSPSFKSWISRDPLEELGCVNLYELLMNCAQVSIDPFGEDVWIENTGSVGGFHQRVCVTLWKVVRRGKVGRCCNGVRYKRSGKYCISFGVREGRGIANSSDSCSGDGGSSDSDSSGESSTSADERSGAKTGVSRFPSGFDGPNLSGDGIVYVDNKNESTKSSDVFSTDDDPCKDLKAQSYMKGLVGQRANYAILFQNCRSFSHAVRDELEVELSE